MEHKKTNNRTLEGYDIQFLLTGSPFLSHEGMDVCPVHRFTSLFLDRGYNTDQKYSDSFTGPYDTIAIWARRFCSIASHIRCIIPGIPVPDQETDRIFHCKVDIKRSLHSWYFYYVNHH